MVGRFLLGVAAASLLSTFTAAYPAGISKREQPDVPETPKVNLRQLEWGDINFIHTTDIHGWLEGHLLQESYTGDLGDFYSFVVRMKEKSRRLKKDLFIVDTGDTHDGNGLSDTTNPHGAVTQPMLLHIPYDILAIGNHELYVNSVTQDVYENYMPHWNGRYLASNVYIKDVNNDNKTIPIGSKYTYFEGEFGTRVLAFGFLFDFTGNGDLSVVNKVEKEIREPWFKEALTSHKPDVIALIGHTGLRFNEFKAAIAAIRQYYPYLPIAVLGGHTHIRDFAVYDAWAAGIESGRYMETIGFYSIDGIKESTEFINEHGYNSTELPGNLTFHRRYLDQNRDTYIFHSDKSAKSFDTKLGLEITKNITSWRRKLGIEEALGCAPQDYYLSAVPQTSNSSIFTLLTQEVLPKTIVNKDRPYPPYIIMNSGGVRYDIYQGNFTVDTVYQVSPFVDEFLYIAGVPYEAASQLLSKINNDPNSVAKRALLESLTCEKVDRLVRHKSPLTPGYVTKDDLGTDGDDTKHDPIPYYEATTYVATELPKNTSSPVDLVVIDFVSSYVLSTLNEITGKNYTLEPELYTNLTSSSMWLEFAPKYWKQNCQ
ncbi:hypothetical protein VTP01DRAFT_9658 [Rhizomucor pusillus]|uniref:uncharacterized protein n=1 Tax=Rhizomucor pusillus TaxID=4840 RepID=UPI0037436665